MARPCLVYSTIDLIGNLILLAGLSYLGFGVQPPTAELGSIIADGQGYLLTAWWIATLPGLVLVLFGVGVGLIGEGFSDRGLEGRTMSLLEIEALRVEFPGEDGPLVAVKGVDLAIEPGEVLGLVGESGSGKSLTCRAVMQLVPEPGRVASGAVRFDGEDVLDARQVEAARLPRPLGRDDLPEPLRLAEPDDAGRRARSPKRCG